jgi:hypothetical protein
LTSDTRYLAAGPALAPRGDALGAEPDGAADGLMAVPPGGRTDRNKGLTQVGTPFAVNCRSAFVPSARRAFRRRRVAIADETRRDPRSRMGVSPVRAAKSSRLGVMVFEALSLCWVRA